MGKVYTRNRLNQTGFTIVELLIVIVVIGILAAITVVAYNGVQQRAANAKRMNDIKSVAKVIELYYADNGTYPLTGSVGTAVNSDSRCSVGTQSIDWVPDVVPKYSSSLPQSDGKEPNGANSGCYKYWSNGTYYVVSAWIAVAGDPQTSTMYKRAGFRERSNGASDQYYCNHASMGGMGSGAGPYNVSNDLYKKSYTITSPITPNSSLNGTCIETPPVGA